MCDKKTQELLQAAERRKKRAGHLRIRTGTGKSRSEAMFLFLLGSMGVGILVYLCPFFILIGFLWLNMI